mgnify:CR=1 FL=1
MGVFFQWFYDKVALKFAIPILGLVLLFIYKVLREVPRNIVKKFNRFNS